ncbi:MAG: SLC13 family permease [Candidatus Aminicenantes bacterium]|nr:SLC13 family permease [Candidatus Aminicenantes bacterium]
MIVQQIVIFSVLVLTFALFVWGRLRYDVVAVLALLVVTLAGLVPAREAFLGFGHPAVITVAAVLILSRGLMNSGLIDGITSLFLKVGRNPTAQVAALAGITACFSMFMNNVGALAVMLPVAVQISRKSGRSPYYLLMPIAFGSLLGGLMTMIGTPPNIIIAMARAKSGAEPFAMFDFAPVGVGAAAAGLFFISVVGWRLIPVRKGRTATEELFRIEDYLTEIRVTKDSPLAGERLSAIKKLKDVQVNVVGIGRGKRKIAAPSPREVLEAGDILVVEADSDDLEKFLRASKFELAEEKKLGKDILGSEDIGLHEAVLMSDSPLIGNTALGLNLRRRHDLNLLAVARKGVRLKGRLAVLRFQAGDILLFSGPREAFQESFQRLGCLPLFRKNIGFGKPQRVFLGAAIFSFGIAAAALGVLPVPVALMAAAAAMVLAGLVSVREIYDSVDWPVIVLLGAMIPVGRALETSGGVESIVGLIVRFTGDMPPSASLVILLVGTMFLSDVINNAATAVLMAPVAISLATSLGVSADPFLMAVAVGASCAFLTPVGHQSNTLVMGPAGYRFGDYWRLGLPLEIIIVLASVPLILRHWPL